MIDATRLFIGRGIGELLVNFSRVLYWFSDNNIEEKVAVILLTVVRFLHLPSQHCYRESIFVLVTLLTVGRHTPPSLDMCSYGI